MTALKCFILFLNPLRSGTLQLRYNLGGLRDPFTIDIDQRNLANGQPHTVNISRVERDIVIQVKHTEVLTNEACVSTV